MTAGAATGAGIETTAGAAEAAIKGAGATDETAAWVAAETTEAAGSRAATTLGTGVEVAG